MADVEFIRSKLTMTPDFPKKGINFLDFLPILRDPLAFETLITHFVSHITTKTIPSLPSSPSPSVKPVKIDAVVGLDSRGFLIGPIIAMRLGAKFIPVRKAGKLPGKTISATYEKEYGSDSFEIQEGAIEEGDHVIVVDDLIATGGSAKAAGELVAKSGGKTVEYLFVIGLTFLKGWDKLDAPAYSIIESDD
ncbi:adenine phosphoribosyltransferase [Clavulina sp. PMI_390]|nr:adenine phosphoribosyltransferase [Clavulina sp. PMI_390]